MMVSTTPILFINDGVKIKLVPTSASSNPQSSKEANETLLTFAQVEKSVAKGEEVFVLVVLEENKAEETINPKVQPLLEAFHDVLFGDIPNSLPPMRNIQHRIDLVPGASLLKQGNISDESNTPKRIVASSGRIKG